MVSKRSVFASVCLVALCGSWPVVADEAPVEARSEASAPAAAAQPLRDGKLFDPGITMTQPAAGAHEDLARWTPFLGDWDVEMDIHRPGPDGPIVLNSTGHAKITWMNRGHAALERIRIADFDGEGHAMASHTFVVVDGNGVWTVGEANSWTQAVTLTNGGFDDKGRLVLHDAIRPGGGVQLMLLRRMYTPGKATAGQPFDTFTSSVELSNDLGETWNPVVERRFTRRAASDEFFPVRSDVGEPAPDRMPEAAEFDFLIGEYDATNWLQRPGGERRWQSNATAVHILDGHGILEFGSFDSDPNLPDAATSIVRIYNASMRRWECLYLNNRTQTALYFGGVREGDQIVLHPFDAQTAGNPIFQWIFYEVEDNSYRWKGIQSTDRGGSWNPTWTIDFARKGVPAPAEAAASSSP